VTKLRAGLPRSRDLIFSKDKMFLLSASCPIQRPVQCVLNALSAGGMQPASDADNSVSSTAEVRNG
jgi:hypothetical protein